MGAIYERPLLGTMSLARARRIQHQPHRKPTFSSVLLRSCATHPKSSPPLPRPDLHRRQWSAKSLNFAKVSHMLPVPLLQTDRQTLAKRCLTLLPSISSPLSGSSSASTIPRLARSPRPWRFTGQRDSRVVSPSQSPP